MLIAKKVTKLMFQLAQIWGIFFLIAGTLGFITSGELVGWKGTLLFAMIGATPLLCIYTVRYIHMRLHR